MSPCPPHSQSHPVLPRYMLDHLLTRQEEGNTDQEGGRRGGLLDWASWSLIPFYFGIMLDHLLTRQEEGNTDQEGGRRGGTARLGIMEDWEDGGVKLEGWVPHTVTHNTQSQIILEHNKYT